MNALRATAQLLVHEADHNRGYEKKNYVRLI